MKEKKRIYLDYASTTPIDDDVVRAMKPYLQESFANPSAIYREGVFAKRSLSEARTSIARVLSCKSEEIIFTASGTESNNLALLGVFRAAKKKIAKPHIITTKIEHPSVLEVMEQIEREGGEVSYVGVAENGIVRPVDIQKALRPETILISIMYANNEMGTIQPLREIFRVIQNFQKTKSGGVKSGNYPYLHTDASQAANYLSLNVDSLGVDLMTLDASKIYGPKGVGALFIKKKVSLNPIIFGGGQERGLRSGTENVAGIVGMAKAIEIAGKFRNSESGEISRLAKLRDYFISEVLKRFGEARLNGDPKLRLPNNVNICFPGVDAEFAVLKLDNAGISCASASACNNLSENSASYVIGALPKGKECAKSSLRFTLGRSTTKKEIDTVLEILPTVI